MGTHGQIRPGRQAKDLSEHEGLPPGAELHDPSPLLVCPTMLLVRLGWPRQENPHHVDTSKAQGSCQEVCAAQGRRVWFDTPWRRERKGLADRIGDLTRATLLCFPQRMWGKGKGKGPLF